MIAKQYHEHLDGPPERAYLLELEGWLLAQPQDAWLLFVRTMNWDVADGIAEKMIADPQCDIAVAATIFWDADPAFRLRNPASPVGSRLCDTIIENFAKGHYRRSDLALERFEIAHAVRAYGDALRDPKVGGRSLGVPRALFGPFEGRQAKASRPDASTMKDLRAIQKALGFEFALSHQQWIKDWGSNYWIRHHLKFPDIPARPWQSLSNQSEADYVDRLFGKRKAFEKARAAANAAFGPPPDRTMEWIKWLIWPGLAYFAAGAFTLAIVVRRIHFGVWF